MATLTLKNAQGIDVLAAKPNSSHAVQLQVKSSQSVKGHWMLSEKAERHHAPSLFYVFVRLSTLGTLPLFHVVPSQTVADYAASHHQEWLKGLKANGTSRKDTSMRAFRDEGNQYLDRWELLG